MVCLFKSSTSLSWSGRAFEFIHSNFFFSLVLSSIHNIYVMYCLESNYFSFALLCNFTSNGKWPTNWKPIHVLCTSENVYLFIKWYAKSNILPKSQIWIGSKVSKVNAEITFKSATSGYYSTCPHDLLFYYKLKML